MDWWGIVAEAIKGVVQLGTGLGLGFFAVRWALRRYEREKRWEKSLILFADAVGALAEMRFVTGTWLEDEQLRKDRTPSHIKLMDERYRAARRRFDDAVALGHLLASKEASDVLCEIQTRVEMRPPFDTAEEAYERDWDLLQEGVDRLSSIAKRELRFKER